jgi:hypothetical protein
MKALLPAPPGVSLVSGRCGRSRKTASIYQACHVCC